MVISTNSPAIAGKNRCLLLIVLEEKLLLQLLLQLQIAYGCNNHTHEKFVLLLSEN